MVGRNVTRGLGFIYCYIDMQWKMLMKKAFHTAYGTHGCWWYRILSHTIAALCFDYQQSEFLRHSYLIRHQEPLIMCTAHETLCRQPKERVYVRKKLPMFERRVMPSARACRRPSAFPESRRSWAWGNIAQSRRSKDKDRILVRLIYGSIDRAFHHRRTTAIIAVTPGYILRSILSHLYRRRSFAPIIMIPYCWLHYAGNAIGRLATINIHSLLVMDYRMMIDAGTQNDDQEVLTLEAHFIYALYAYYAMPRRTGRPLIDDDYAHSHNVSLRKQRQSRAFSRHERWNNAELSAYKRKMA